MPTINDIAAAVSLSRQTVSQILRNPDNPAYPAKTRSRVLTEARRIHYVPNILARGLAQGKTHLLSLILPFNIPELMDTAQQAARQAGYGLMMQFTPRPEAGMERAELLAALERRVDGILWMPCSAGVLRDNPDIVAQLGRMPTPVVFLESTAPGAPSAAMVRPDYAGGGKLVVRHLLDQGYRRVVYVCPYVERFDRLRIRDFRRSAADAGIACEVVKIGPDEKAHAAVAACLASGERPVAFYCMGDVLALDVIEAARAAGFSMPRDVGVVTLGDLMLFGRTRFGDLIRPGLTAVPQPFGPMAREGVRLLTDPEAYRMASSRGGPPVPVGLVARQSTARRPARVRLGSGGVCPKIRQQD